MPRPGIARTPTIPSLNRITGYLMDNQFEKVCEGFTLGSAAWNLTATPSGTQANALQLSNESNHISTAVATSAPYDAVALPPAEQGMTVVVTNHSSNYVAVFPYYNNGSPSDQIDDLGATVAALQMQGSVVTFNCTAPGVWYTSGLGSGFAGVSGGNFATFSTIDGLTAKVGGGQAGATQILASQVFFSVVNSIGDSAILPMSKAGMEVTVINKTGTQMAVFAATGENINGGAANGSVNINGNSILIFFCGTAGGWWTK